MKGEINMTIEARYNLQRGITEDNKYSSTRYNIESLLDAYILARRKNNRLILDAANTDKAIEAAGEALVAAAYKELDKLLQDFK